MFNPLSSPQAPQLPARQSPPLLRSIQGVHSNNSDCSLAPLTALPFRASSQLEEQVSLSSLYRFQGSLLFRLTGFVTLSR